MAKLQLPPTKRLLIVGTGAKRVSDETQARLRVAFDGYRLLEFPPKEDFTHQLTAKATVVVAGGDGTVGYVARRLAGSKRRLGILPLGTFNNLALGLGLPEDLDRAIPAIRAGKRRAVTLGQAEDKPFLGAPASGPCGAATRFADEAQPTAIAG